VNLDPSAFVADPELIRELEVQSTQIACPEDRVLFRQGDAPMGLYILKSGKAALTMNAPSGEEIVTSNASSSSLLGLPGLIGNEPYTLTAVASAGSEVSLLSRDSFTTLMRTNPLLALKVLQILAAEVRSARSAILQR
jgi:CRP-like cAMP-binding protein